jgi:hypothetical protein
VDVKRKKWRRPPQKVRAPMRPGDWLSRWADWRFYAPGHPKREAYEIIRAASRAGVGKEANLTPGVHAVSWKDRVKK